MIILAIDPGFEKVGYALFDKKGHNDYTFIASGLIKTLRTDTMTDRLGYIWERLDNLIQEYNPEKIIMEQLFFFKNQKTIIGVAQAQGVVMALAGTKEIPLILLTPLQIKQAITGYGRADKKQVAAMLPLLMKQTIKTQDDDEDDAIACGLTYCVTNVLVT